SHDEAFCLALAAGLESRSEHSLAKPFQAITDPVSVEGIENIPGQGLQGSYQGQVVAIGTQQFVQGVLKIDSAPQFSGKTGSPLYLGWAGEWLAIITLQDEVREGAQNLVASLSGKQLSILSGDHAVAVDALAEIVGIDESLSRQTPESKLAYVQQLQAQGAIVAMVGDGINDAPVLAAADVSIAMGSGTELAQTSADIVLLSEKLDVLSFGFSVAIKTVQIIKQNLWWALGYNLLALPLAAAGFIEPWMAAIGMSLSSIIVVLNALRLGRLKVSQ
ncbi:MAG: HAD-IC family P-type ATPase, partial [Methylococcales bacterium]|nr:HAD-IC family P-type ATPase [Methylococcales bacterium]